MVVVIKVSIPHYLVLELKQVRVCLHFSRFCIDHRWQNSCVFFLWVFFLLGSVVITHYNIANLGDFTQVADPVYLYPTQCVDPHTTHLLKPSVMLMYVPIEKLLQFSVQETNSTQCDVPHRTLNPVHCVNWDSNYYWPMMRAQACLILDSSRMTTPGLLQCRQQWTFIHATLDIL